MYELRRKPMPNANEVCFTKGRESIPRNRSIIGVRRDAVCVFRGGAASRGAFSVGRTGLQLRSVGNPNAHGGSIGVGLICRFCAQETFDTASGCLHVRFAIVERPDV
jgi:hypothetical protein